MVVFGISFPLGESLCLGLTLPFIGRALASAVCGSLWKLQQLRTVTQIGEIG